MNDFLLKECIGKTIKSIENFDGGYKIVFTDNYILYMDSTETMDDSDIEFYDNERAFKIRMC